MMETDKKLAKIQVNTKSGKKIITANIKTIEPYILSGNLENIIDYLNKILENYKDDYDNLEINMDYYDNYSRSCKIEIRGTRLETDREFEKRNRMEEKEKLLILKKEENEKKLLERLKKKYEIK